MNCCAHIVSRTGRAPWAPSPMLCQIAYTVLVFASFCLDSESLWGISVENKQACSVFTAELETQLYPLRNKSLIL